MDPLKHYFDKLIWFFVNKTLFSKLVNESGTPINPATEEIQNNIYSLLKDFIEKYQPIDKIERLHCRNASDRCSGGYGLRD